jgi:hypothetical protein
MPPLSRPLVQPLPASVTHFYRYKSASNLETHLKPVILNHRIWVPMAGQLNDRMEAKPLFAEQTAESIADYLMQSFVERTPNATHAMLEKAGREIGWLCKTESSDSLLRSMMDSFHSATEQTRIFSMAHRWNHMAMWAKYAGDHQGYCLEFDRRVHLFRAARAVIYDDSMRVDILDETHHTPEWFYCKSPDWSNEEEIRLVLPRLMGGPEFDITSQGLTRIILGDQMSADDETLIRCWADTRDPKLAVVKTMWLRHEHRLVMLP